MQDRPIVSPDVTIRDVAEAAGVSISLVSFVLNARRAFGSGIFQRSLTLLVRTDDAE